MGPLIYGEDSQREPGGELSRCAVQAGSQPVLPPGAKPRGQGLQRTAEHPTTETQPGHLARPCSALGSQRHRGNLTWDSAVLSGRKGSLTPNHSGLVVKTGDPPPSLSSLDSFSHLTPGLRTTYPAQLSLPSPSKSPDLESDFTFSISRNAQVQGDFCSS